MVAAEASSDEVLRTKYLQHSYVLVVLGAGRALVEEQAMTASSTATNGRFHDARRGFAVTRCFLFVICEYISCPKLIVRGGTSMYHLGHEYGLLVHVQSRRRLTRLVLRPRRSQTLLALIDHLGRYLVAGAAAAAARRSGTDWSATSRTEPCCMSPRRPG